MLIDRYYRTFKNGAGSIMLSIPAILNLPVGTNIKFKLNKNGTILIIPEGVKYEETN